MDGRQGTQGQQEGRQAGTPRKERQRWHNGFFRKTRSERGIAQARNDERTTKLLRKKIRAAGPMQWNHPGQSHSDPPATGMAAYLHAVHPAACAPPEKAEPGSIWAINRL
jgi:hypothetical protein